MAKRVTVYDIARELSISPSTVSRVLNNSVLVSDEKRALILHTADRLGYRKRVIRKQKNRAILNIVLVLPFRHEPGVDLFFAVGELISAIRVGIGETRTNVIVEVNDDELSLLDNKKLGDIDGIIFAFTDVTQQVLDLVVEREVPLVMINRLQDGADYVASDNEGGMALLLEKILERRQRPRVCFLGFRPIRYVSELRRNGVATACRTKGLAFGSRDAIELDSLADITSDLVHTLTERGYDAVMCVNDVVAVAVYQAALHSGMSIPESFSLTGYDNSPIRALFPKKIDTINLSTVALGKEAGGWLRRRIIERTQVGIQKRILGEYVPGNTI
jgi:DNA-binding LacI/PurR family transcriptional regulator